LDFGGL